MPETEVDTFAGIDVSARELNVALCRGKAEDKPAMAKFSNHPSGHKALIAHLLRGGRRVRVCLEASGNYSLDLALTLQAHCQVEISVINPRRARRFAESLGQRSKTDPCCPTCWMRASGWPSADWIRGSSQGNRSRSGLGSAGVVVVTCVVLSTCQRWSLYVAILICAASIKTY
jgi:hypothetical protein